jgi:hypothetical protein
VAPNRAIWHFKLSHAVTGACSPDNHFALAVLEPVLRSFTAKTLCM